MQVIAKNLGLKTAGKTKTGATIYKNNGPGPKFLVKSNTSHKGDVFKGFDTKKAAESGLTDADTIEQISGLNKLLDSELQQGDINSAKQTNEMIRSYGNN